MKLQQLSLFLENKPGALRAPCDVLAAAGIETFEILFDFRSLDSGKVMFA